MDLTEYDCFEKIAVVNMLPAFVYGPLQKGDVFIAKSIGLCTVLNVAPGPHNYQIVTWKPFFVHRINTEVACEHDFGLALSMASDIVNSRLVVPDKLKSCVACDYSDLHFCPFANGMEDENVEYLTTKDNRYVLMSVDGNLPVEFADRV